MIKQLFAVAAAVVIAGAAVAAPAPNPYSDRLQKLDPLQRHSVLRRAVLDSGEQCKRVDKALQKGGYKNLAMWTVRCMPGGDYGVFIGPDASVQVRPCGDLRGLNLPTCAALP